MPQEPLRFRVNDSAAKKVRHSTGKRSAVGNKSGSTVANSVPVLRRPTSPPTAGRKPAASPPSISDVGVDVGVGFGVDVGVGVGVDVGVDVGVSRVLCKRPRFVFGDGAPGKGAVPLPRPISVEVGCSFIA